MRIISERRAMTIYRQHPAPAFFDTAPADTSGTAVSVITLVWSFLTFRRAGGIRRTPPGPQRTLYLSDEYHPELTI
ncbi:hypothetical protein J2T25_003384 [Citrobacter amalonaticus]|nr:DUF987 domain-containing protein [Citrobacter amalonaticus]MCP1630414.1 hypothetical protein [Citrobacter amalonaticus]